jgi:hypothetical protein
MAVEKKKEAVEPKKSMAQELDAIAAKNSQIITVRNIQQEKERLKDRIGRKPKRASGDSGVQGLASLKNTLGRQNMRALNDYQ